MTRDEFIQKAFAVRGNRYDYSRVLYHNNVIKVEIQCSSHGAFYQRPYSHLGGSGCPSCNVRHKRNTSTFIDHARTIHGNTYDYSLVQYTRNDEAVSIICKLHGEFSQTPLVHTTHGSGCPKCVNISTDEFIRRAEIIHGTKYDYSMVRYVRSDRKVDILCRKHGVFKQKPNAHISSGHGCPKCSHRISVPERKWLDEMGVPDTSLCRQVYVSVKDKKVLVDGYVTSTNTVYEFYGDYWHGNPARFPPGDINTRVGMSFGELYERTISKRNELIEAGYRVVEMWENDWK